MASTRISLIRGPEGEKGDAGDMGPAGPNTVPTQQAVADALTTPGSVAEAAVAAKNVSALEEGSGDFYDAFMARVVQLIADATEAQEAVNDRIRTLRPSVYGDPSGQPNGTPTHLSDGTPVTTFGNSTFIVENGVFTSNLFQGAQAGAYMQTDDLGSRVDRASGTLLWQVGETDTAAIVIPAVGWYLPGGLSAAAFHLTITYSGTWTLGRWDGAGSTRIFRTGTIPAMNDGIPRPIDCWRDPVRPDTFNIALPNGKVVAVSDPTLASEAGTHVVWERYAPNGTGVDAGSWTEVYAETQDGSKFSARAMPQAKELQRLLAGVSVGPSDNTWAPSALTTVAVPNGTPAIADVNTANGFVTFTAGASGKVRLEAESWIEPTTTSRYFQRFRIINGTATGGGTLFGNTPGVRILEDLAASPRKGRATYRWQVVGLTPFATYTGFLQHWYDNGGSGLNLVANQSGQNVYLAATPLMDGSIRT